MSSFLFWASIGAVLGLTSASLFEWLLHRYPMHMPRGAFRYPFERHTLVHHRIFKADHTYHLAEDKDKHTIAMAWWNGPVLIAICQSPFFIAAAISHQWGIFCGATLTMTAYYAAY